MPLYKFKAFNSEGTMVEDKIESQSELEAISEIQRRGLTLLEIKVVNSIITSLNRKKVSKKELAEFAKSLSYLIETGIALHRGVEIISEQTRNTYFKSVITQLIKDIKEGTPLSQACSKHPKVFPESMVFQLQAAESGGFMGEALVNIAFNFERDASFTKQVRGALVYPSMVLLISFGIVYFMLIAVVPKMTGTLASFDAELPAITQFVMAVSDIAKKYWYTLFIAIGGVVYLFRFMLQSEDRVKKYHKFLLKIPVVGQLIISVNIARMTRVMSSLLSSGVPIDDTLENLKNVISNKIIAGEIQKIRVEVVEQGFALSRALEDKPIFPKMLVQIVKVGEESGSLEEVLKNLAEKLEEDVSDLLKTLTSLVNPILMIVVGAIVGVIVMSLFLPMFSLMDSL